MEMILSGSDLYLVYVEGHRLKSNLEACTSVWASVVISIPDCLRLMYLGYLNKYVCLRLRPKKKNHPFLICAEFLLRAVLYQRNQKKYYF